MTQDEPYPSPSSIPDIHGRYLPPGHKCDRRHTYLGNGGASLRRPEAQKHPSQAVPKHPPLRKRPASGGPFLFAPRVGAQAPTGAERRSRIAASMRSAMRGPVKPTSSCRRAALPWVT